MLQVLRMLLLFKRILRITLAKRAREFIPHNMHMILLPPSCGFIDM